MLRLRSTCAPLMALSLLAGLPCFAQSQRWIEARTGEDVEAEARAGHCEWFEFLDAALGRVDERRAVRRVGAGEWRYRVGGIAEAWEFPEGTDGWTPREPGGDFHNDGAVVWWRAEAVVPERLGGIPVAGLPLGLRMDYRENMRVYVNGEDRGCFNHTMSRYWPVTDAAVPGERFIVSCCVEGKGEPGRVEWAEWFLAGTEEFTALCDTHFARLQACADNLKLLHDLHRTFDVRAAFDKACAQAAEVLDASSIDQAKTRLEASIRTLERLKALRAGRTPVITRGPDVELAADGGATVTWETDVPADSYLWYAPEGDTNAREVAEKKAVTAHSLALQRLSAGERYSYRVGSGGVRSALHIFMAGPPVSGPEWAKSRVSPPVAAKSARVVIRAAD